MVPPADLPIKSKERNRVWTKRGVIAAVILALIVCCIFWYMDQKKEIELHTINGEKVESQETQEFNLNWK